MNRRILRALGVGTTAALALGTVHATFIGPAGAEQPAPGACAPVASAGTLQEAFDAAADSYDVPVALLKAISYMQSRWDGHDGRPSVDDGYGIFNLRNHAPGTDEGGAGSTGKPDGPAVSQVDRAAALTGLTAELIRTDDAANVCAGAALLHDYAATIDPGADLADWSLAVARFNDSEAFAGQVLRAIRTGHRETLPTGETVTLAAHRDVVAPRAIAVANDPGTDCPAGLGCEWVPAPYAKDDPTAPDSTSAYGNHDLANRTGLGSDPGTTGPRIRYIVIHGTEGTYQSSVNLVQDPTYLAWNYTLRSGDGHVAQHLDPKDVGWHAGNWYVNMHSIGLEHEGFSGTDGWWTESMYETSATLVTHLAAEYDIPLDRQHVIGHDQIPGTVAGNSRTMHWDPGPYWDWDHYFDLLGAPVADADERTTRIRPGDIVAVNVGQQTATLTGCSYLDPATLATETDCAADEPVNYVTLYAGPDEASGLAPDPAQGGAGSAEVSDETSRATSGTRFRVVSVQDDWVQVDWAGSAAWLHNPRSAPVLQLARGATLTNLTEAASATYGRAYPEADAYAGTDVPVQSIVANEGTVAPGQSYVVAERGVQTDYYRATTFDGSGPGDRYDVVGSTRYDQIEFAHRFVFVQSDGLTYASARDNLNPVTARRAPRITGTPSVGKRVRATSGTWTRDTIDRFRYRWFADGRVVAGGTGPTLLLRPALRGARLTVRVTVDDPAMTPTSAYSARVRVRR